MTNLDFSARRAKPGFGARKAELLRQLWHAENDITHYIIAFVAGRDSVQDAKRKQAEVERDLIVAVLLQITKEPK